MRTFDALACAILAIGIGIAAPAFAADSKISSDTPPADALRLGLSALKSGNTDVALDTISLGDELPENLELGDLVYTENIGAYSHASATFAGDNRSPSRARPLLRRCTSRPPTPTRPPGRSGRRAARSGPSRRM